MDSEIRKYILEQSDRSKDYIGHTCSNCIHYTEDGQCDVATQVVDAHGEPNLKRWLRYPAKDNSCNLFKSESGVTS